MTQRYAEYRRIDEALSASGLMLRGGVPLERSDLEEIGAAPARGTLLLIGNAGPEMWRHFSADPIARDGAPDPMNRWSEKVIDRVARSFDAKPLYPHTGPPFLPFLGWAQRADDVQASPLGLFIHPEYGLWHAYRGALVLDRTIPLPAKTGRPSPCLSCAAKPCLGACPVPGVDPIRDHVIDCTAHPRGAACLDSGCAARRACPVGREYRYAPDHMRFHMQSFVRAHGRDSST